MTKPHSLLTPDEARQYYDGFGGKQDSQGFYERPALADLVTHLELDKAHSVLEFGCGTGRFAAEILGDRMSPTAEYLGLDISGTMVALARDRIRPFGQRATVRQTDGSFRIAAPQGAFDRIIVTYVLDLLSEGDIDKLMGEMYRALKPGGLIGVVSLTDGSSGIPRAVSKIWRWIHRLSPWLVGGCRPIEVVPFLSSAQWKVRYCNVVTPYAVASEIMIAERSRKSAGP